MLHVLVFCVILNHIESVQYYAQRSCPIQCICSPKFTDCKSNNLTQIPQQIDQNVTVLDLAYNNFETFPIKLNGYPTLENLNFSHNHITTLHDDSFRNLTKLVKLDLTHNRFSDWLDITPNALTPAASLWFLDLSHNPLKTMPRDRNNLQSNSLRILRLVNCSINQLNSKILEKLPNLGELHLSDNPLEHLTNFNSKTLKFLDLARCNLQYASPSSFVGATALETVYMQHNANLKAFHCNSDSIRFLDLSNCNIDLVPTGRLPKLYRANFSENRFRTISKKAFQNYTQLQILDLSHNSIAHLDADAFTETKNLKAIDLSKNQLPEINGNTFTSKFLNLSRNYINTFPQLISSTLEVLDLSHCEISSITYDTLIDLPALDRLSLSKNPISLLPDFWQSQSLTDLDVSYCRIKTINNKTFLNMPALKSLTLVGNRLTTVPSDSFLQVISLDITDNPWRCECQSLRQFYEWLSKTGKTLDGLTCQSPDIVEGRSWLSACQSEWLPSKSKKDTLWYYTTGLIITVFVILFVILAMRRMYLLKEKRIRQQNQARRMEEREALRRMERVQLEFQDDSARNAPDPRELQTPPSYNEALLLPKLDASHPSLFGSLHSIASKQSLNGSSTDVSRRNRPRRKRRRRNSSDSRRASRDLAESDSSIPRALESDV